MHPLTSYLESAAQTRYQIGLHDCITHISRLADLIAGTDITGSLSGTYATKWGGLARHAKGGLADAIRTHLLHHGFTLAPPPYQNADIILTDLDHPGIWFENQIQAQPVACTGTLTLHPRHAKQALRWPHPSPYHEPKKPEPTPAFSPWIPVAERMPPVGRDVFTYGKSTLGTCPGFQRVYNDGRGNPVFAQGWNKGQTFEVTHWSEIFTPNSPI